MTRRQFLATSGLAGMTAASGLRSARAAEPLVELEGLRYRPRWFTVMGATEACLDFLGVDVSAPWLWGASGYTFFMATCDDLCPSSMFSHSFWMHSLGRNVGYETEGAFSFRHKPEFEEEQRKAWDLTRAAIDVGHPGLLWEWEWLLIRGYDHDGYYLSGKAWPDEDEPMPWERLGGTDVGWLELAVLEPAPAKPDEQILRESLTFAVESWDDPAKWTMDDYAGGPVAYDLWLEALADPDLSTGPNAAMHAATYAESRGLAPLFLEEAAERLPGEREGLASAAGAFEMVADQLAEAALLLPFIEAEADDEAAQADAAAKMEANYRDPERRAASAGHVQAAKEQETAGIEALRAIGARL